jgi:hypothetical protein
VAPGIEPGPLTTNTEFSYHRNTKKNAYRLLVGKPRGNSPLRRPKRRWLDNINMDVGDIGWIGLIWLKIGLS